jgi:hypothetical protein
MHEPKTKGYESFPITRRDLNEDEVYDSLWEEMCAAAGLDSDEVTEDSVVHIRVYNGEYDVD